MYAVKLVVWIDNLGVLVPTLASCDQATVIRVDHFRIFVRTSSDYVPAVNWIKDFHILIPFRNHLRRAAVVRLDDLCVFVSLCSDFDRTSIIWIDHLRIFVFLG